MVPRQEGLFRGMYYNNGDIMIIIYFVACHTENTYFRSFLGSSTVALAACVTVSNAGGGIGAWPGRKQVLPFCGQEGPHARDA